MCVVVVVGGGGGGGGGVSVCLSVCQSVAVFLT